MTPTANGEQAHDEPAGEQGKFEELVAAINAVDYRSSSSEMVRFVEQLKAIIRA